MSGQGRARVLSHRRQFGDGRRVIQEELRVAEALEELPLLDAELRRGSLNFSVVRELTRVATPDTEGEWPAVARGKTVRQWNSSFQGVSPESP